MVDINKYRGLDNADLAKVLGVDVATIAKYCGINWLAAPVIPAGVIFPFNSSAAAPSLWSLWNPGARHIIGAGSSYGIGSTGGTATIPISIAANSGHNGSATNTWLGMAGSQAINVHQSSRGAHSHTATLTYTGPYRQVQFIKVTTPTAIMPSGAAALCHGSLDTSGLTQWWNADSKILKVSSSLASGGGTVPGAVGSSSGGSHIHGTAGGWSDNPCASYSKALLGLYNGSQAHTITPTIATHAILRRRLTAWGKVAAHTLRPGMIGLYENTTPPAGWALCNGSNGTPDMRNYFCELSTVGNENTSAGNNTLALTWTVSNHSSHNHLVGLTKKWTSISSWYHHSNTAHANNHGTTQTPSYMPPYYGLAFIMYTG